MPDPAHRYIGKVCCLLLVRAEYIGRAPGRGPEGTGNSSSCYAAQMIASPEAQAGAPLSLRRLGSLVVQVELEVEPRYELEGSTAACGARSELELGINWRPVDLPDRWSANDSGPTAPQQFKRPSA